MEAIFETPTLLDRLLNVLQPQATASIMANDSASEPEKALRTTSTRRTQKGDARNKRK